MFWTAENSGMELLES